MCGASPTCVRAMEEVRTLLPFLSTRAFCIHGVSVGQAVAGPVLVPVPWVTEQWCYVMVEDPGIPWVIFTLLTRRTGFPAGPS